MRESLPGSTYVPDAEELLLGADGALVCETYIFEPELTEKSFGYLFAAAQVARLDGLGEELLNTIMAAVQSEYYRDTHRSSEASFEMALHQANLILHDLASQGSRDWMSSLQVAIGVVSETQLQLSVAGLGAVLLVRGDSVTNVSNELGQSPIVNPLQSFSQVASGRVQPKDFILFTTPQFIEAFSAVEMARAARLGAASHFLHRLHDLYQEQHLRLPVSVVATRMMPISHPTAPVAATSLTSTAPHGRPSAVTRDSLRPRQPLLQRKSVAWQMLVFLGELLMVGLRRIKSHLLLFGRGRSAVDSEKTHESSTLPTPKQPFSFKKRSLLVLAWLAGLPLHLRRVFSQLPISSKIFGVFSVFLLVALGVSLIFLYQKRTSDLDIEQASQILHEARIKKDAAQTALIYDNREQAQTFLAEARSLAEKLGQTGLYQDETVMLRSEIQEELDSLQRVTRSQTSNSRELGTFAGLAGVRGPLSKLFLIDTTLYSLDPQTNKILAMDFDGSARVVQEETKNVGFFRTGAVHLPDKMLTLLTDPAGLVLYDARDNSLSTQAIDLPGEAKALVAMALFGNRLYVYDNVLQKIFTYNKTLRGYGSGTAWFDDPDLKLSEVASLAVDGNIYTLSQDGSVRKFFKGAEADFVPETITPPLNGAADIYTNDDLRYLYVVDRTRNRVVILTKAGALVRQLYFEEDTTLTDIAVPTTEDRLYVLQGDAVVEVLLGEG